MSTGYIRRRLVEADAFMEGQRSALDMVTRRGLDRAKEGIDRSHALVREHRLINEHPFMECQPHHGMIAAEVETKGGWKPACERCYSTAWDRGHRVRKPQGRSW